MRRLSVLLIFLMCSFSSKAIEILPKFWININEDVTFNLYSLKNPLVPQTLKINDIKSIDESRFDPEIPTRIFIHGYFSLGQIRRTFIDGFLTKGARNVNLIEVNWESASRTLNYYAATRYVPSIGSRVAEFVDFMVNNKKLKLSDLTVIGFSLGSHIAGHTGKRLTVGKLPKIVGLDPARLFFSIDRPNNRLNKDDALYVETIHTSKLGFNDPIGAVAFYPFGLRIPGCWWDFTGKCAHGSAYKYYAQSVSSNQPLFGHLCNSVDYIKEGNCTSSNQKAIMGGEPGVLQQSPGVYYIEV